MKDTPLSMLRRSLMLRQTEIASRMGKSSAWISALETGRNIMTSEQLRSLASALKLPVSRVEMAALETRRVWLRDQERRIVQKLRTVRKSA